MDQSKQTEAVFKSSRNEVDPVSGNEVPAGALPEEVRDDVPAMLSEGEYVVPADVLRYYGVKFFEDLRNEAKMGLTEMDAGGRIGGEPVEGGDDLPFSDEELMAIDDGEEATPAFAEGGLNIPDFKTPSYVKAPDMSMFGFDAGASASTGGIEFRTYVNSSNMEITIPFFNGEPLGAIPAGYSLKSDATEEVREEAEQVRVEPEGRPDGGEPGNPTDNTSNSSGKGLGLSEKAADAVAKGIVGLGKAVIGGATPLGSLGVGLLSKATDIDEQIAESISKSLQGKDDENVTVDDITKDAIAQSTGVDPSSVSTPSTSSSSSSKGGSEGSGGGNAVGIDGPAPSANAPGDAPGVSAGPTGASSGAASSAAAGSGHEGNADPENGGAMLAKGGLVKRRSKKKK